MICTVPLASVLLSGSLTVIAEVIGTAAPFSVYESAPPSIAARTGASFTGVTVMLRVCVLLLSAPSLTWNVAVRVAALGLLLVLTYVTARSAACQLARVAVAPAEVSAIVPVPAVKTPAMLPIVAGTLVKASTSSPLT